MSHTHIARPRATLFNQTRAGGRRPQTPLPGRSREGAGFCQLRPEETASRFAAVNVCFCFPAALTVQNLDLPIGLYGQINWSGIWALQGRGLGRGGFKTVFPQFCLPKTAHLELEFIPEVQRSNHCGSCPFKVCRIGRRQRIPDSSNHSLYLTKLFNSSYPENTASPPLNEAEEQADSHTTQTQRTQQEKHSHGNPDS